MNKLWILALLLSLGATPALADEAHHQASGSGSAGAASQVASESAELSAHMQRMQTLMDKARQATDPAAKARLIEEHGQLMQEGMEMQAKCPMMSKDHMAMMQMMMEHMQQRPDMMGHGAPGDGTAGHQHGK